MVKHSFGEQLKKYRKSKGLTQEGLSLQSGVTFRFLQDIEAGNKQPTVTTVFKLSEALKVRPGDLLDDVYSKWIASEQKDSD